MPPFSLFRDVLCQPRGILLQGVLQIQQHQLLTKCRGQVSVSGVAVISKLAVAAGNSNSGYVVGCSDKG